MDEYSLVRHRTPDAAAHDVSRHRRPAVGRHDRLPLPRRDGGRVATTRHYLMASPAYMDVAYAINPWMDPTVPFDRDRAVHQWSELVAIYRQLGHVVDVLDATPGLPDLVFAANGALSIDGRALLSRFRHAERRGEEAVHRAWLEAQGIVVDQAVATVEGEGDLLVVGDLILAGAGPRTELDAHAELRRWTDREVVTIDLVNPMFYHLDTAIGVVADDVVAWYPPAMSVAAASEITRRFPDAIVVDDHDAALLGCNLVSDGRNVVIPLGADHLAADLVARGFSPIQIDLSELLLAGGSVKCCTAELFS